MAERAIKNSPYREFSQGQTVTFTLNTLNPDGSIGSQEQQIRVAAIKGGGFFGRVLIPEMGESVIKTSVPDPWHDLWRRVNWGFREFPSQVSETQAQIDFLKANLIADVLSPLTDNKYTAPHSLGYTRFEGGLAQVNERMYGRGPRYDTAENEFEEHQEDREELTNLMLRLGLEDAGQVYRRHDHHKDEVFNNPFGSPNLWRNLLKINQRILIDTSSAIPHNGWIWPFFHFSFHKDLREWFGQKNPTFDRIHTGYFLTEISKNRHLFDDETYQHIVNNVRLYRELKEKRKKEGETSVNLGAVAVAAIESGKEFGVKVGRKIKKHFAFPIKILFDEDYRKEIFLTGPKAGLDNGVLSEDEYQEAKKAIDELEATDKGGNRVGRLGKLAAVWGSHEALGMGLNVAEATTLSYILGTTVPDIFGNLINSGLGYIWELFQTANDPRIAVSLVGFRALGGLVRYADTMTFGKALLGEVTQPTRLLSLFPLGTVSKAAMPVQAAFDIKNKTASTLRSSDIISHYTMRNVVANLSFVLSRFSYGGWGTEIEGKLWQKFARLNHSRF